MLTKVYIDGFRQFKNFSLEPHEQTSLIIGLNGTGKTAFVEVLHRLQGFLTQGLGVAYVCGQNDIPRWDIKDYGTYTTTIGIEMVDAEVTYTYQVEIGREFKWQLCKINTESLFVGDQLVFKSIEGDANVITDDGRTFKYPIDWSLTGLRVAERNSSKIRNFLKVISDNIFAVSLDPHQMTENHKDQEYSIDLFGSNFSAWYECLVGTQMALVAETFKEIAAFIPGFRQFAFDKNGDSKSLFADVAISSEQTYRLSFKELSHGQKILCALHLLVRIAPKNATVVIDEFENYLAPAELQPLYNAAQDAYESRNVQFIFISHHQKTMNWFHDLAFVFTFVGSPAFIRVEKIPADHPLALDECLN